MRQKKEKSKTGMKPEAIPYCNMMEAPVAQTNHKTESIPQRIIDVDEGMIALVQWLNSLDGVNTSYCCQGEYSYPPSNNIWTQLNLPYVIFVCQEDDSLIQILKALRDFAVVSTECGEFNLQVEYYKPQVPVRYVLKFRNRKVLDQFNGYLSKIFAGKQA